MIADALAPCITKSSTPMILTMWNRYVLISKSTVSCQCGRMIKVVSKCWCFLWKIWHIYGYPLKCHKVLQYVIDHYEWLYTVGFHEVHLESWTPLMLKPEYSVITRSMPRLSMPWRCKESDHQQPRYGFCRMNESLTSMSQDFNYLQHLDCEKSFTSQIHFFI